MVLRRPALAKPQERWLLILMHVSALAPLVLLAWGWAGGRLSFNPIREITLRTGRYALTALILSLACRPAYRLSRFRPLLRIRRALGLYAFMYAGLHFLTFVGLDFGFNLGFITDELTQRRFIQAGLAAFLILLPLAITSSRWWMRRLGKNWERLHRLVYLAAVLAIVHFFWLVKGDYRRPLFYGLLLAMLLLVRIPAIGKGLDSLHDRLGSQRRSRRQNAKHQDTPHVRETS